MSYTFTKEELLNGTVQIPDSRITDDQLKGLKEEVIRQEGQLNLVICGMEAMCCLVCCLPVFLCHPCWLNSIQDHRSACTVINNRYFNGNHVFTSLNSQFTCHCDLQSTATVGITVPAYVPAEGMPTQYLPTQHSASGTYAPVQGTGFGVGPPQVIGIETVSQPPLPPTARTFQMSIPSYAKEGDTIQATAPDGTIKKVIVNDLGAGYITVAY